MLYATMIGLLAALRVPLWVRGRRVEGLVDRRVGAPPAPRGTGEPAREAEFQGVVSPGASHSLRVARGILRRLARLPLSPWRSTCLYRSVAECLVLRHYGVPAAIRLGVRNESPPHGPIVAHAWVVYPGSGGADEYVELPAIS